MGLDTRLGMGVEALVGRRGVGVRTAVWALAATAGLATAQTVLLPDLITRESDLYDTQITVEGGRRLLRLSNGTANVGVGIFHVYGVDPGAGNVQSINQRIYRSDGTFFDMTSGQFIYHPTHNHIHVENWANFRLRQFIPGGGVGDVIATGGKTSFCILDLGVYNSSLPGFNPSGQFRSCGGTVQGLSVGWIDVYSKGLDGQWIDITGVGPGDYWLESIVDPADAFIESDETNNATLVKVTIPDPGQGPVVDAYEPNQSLAEVAGRPEGGPSSPNLGPSNPQKRVEMLSIDDAGGDDYFRFYMPATGASGDFVRIEFEHDLGDLDMRLLSSTGTVLASADGVSDSEQISMSGRGAGWYGVRVFGFSGATNPSYRLIIDPSANGAPSVAVIDPPAGDVQREHGTETYDVTWSVSDPENNSMWVTVYANTAPALDGNQVLLPTSVHTPASQGFYVINSAYLDPGTYWIYAEVTDGGTTRGSWSPGTITFTEQDSCPADIAEPFESLDFFDVLAFLGGHDAGEVYADWAAPFGVFNSDDVTAYLHDVEHGCHSHGDEHDHP